MKNKNKLYSLVDLEEYIDVIASVPTDYYREIIDTIKRDVLKDVEQE